MQRLSHVHIIYISLYCLNTHTVHIQLEWLKNKIFKQGIGIAEKSLETRRDRWGGNVNPKSLI